MKLGPYTDRIRQDINAVNEFYLADSHLSKDLKDTPLYIHKYMAMVFPATPLLTVIPPPTHEHCMVLQVYLYIMCIFRECSLVK